MSAQEILDFFMGKGFAVTIHSFKGRVAVNYQGPYRCSFGSVGDTAEEALRSGYEKGVANFGSFTKDEITAHYHEAYEKATGESHAARFGW